MTLVDLEKAVLDDEIDWAALNRRLTAYAVKLVRAMPSIFDGISAGDLASETLMAYYVSETRLGWDPTRGSLVRFLCGVLKRKFLAHVRRHHRCIGFSEVTEVAEVSTHPGPESQAVAIADKIERLRTAAKGDQELEELLDGAGRIESTSKPNEQLSRLLNTSIEDILNRKRRLRRRLDRNPRGHRNRTKADE
jgi:DNA-directed RNA polymerase specialized sigma24 family protein